MNATTTTKTVYDHETIKEYEESLTLTQWQELNNRRKVERDFAKNAGWDYDRYWEVLTLQELREAQG